MADQMSQIARQAAGAPAQPEIDRGIAARLQAREFADRPGPVEIEYPSPPRSEAALRIPVSCPETLSR